MCQHHIIHVNKNPGRGQCSSMDHRFCVSKQGVGLKPHFSTSQGPQLAVESEERGYSYTNGNINCPQDITSTKQLFLPRARKTGSLRELNIKDVGVITFLVADYRWQLRRI